MLGLKYFEIPTEKNYQLTSEEPNFTAEMYLQ
jgi:hypothetical protein